MVLVSLSLLFAVICCSQILFVDVSAKKVTSATPSNGNNSATSSKGNGAARQPAARPAPFCYPALGFEKPPVLPANNTEWWCDPTTEYAFVGFSYEVTACERIF